MAIWKKVVVSGSNISQLNNDSGYLTSATLTSPNAFATASIAGTNLLANSPSGSLNFASSSGQGLTISGNSGNDTLTFGLSAIPNSSLANSTISGKALGTNLDTLREGTGITLLQYNGSAAATVSISGSSNLNANSLIKWTGTAFDRANITDNGTLVTISLPLTVTGSIIATTGFTGSLQGTASWANSASQALTASFLPVGTYNITASWAQSASNAINAQTASNIFPAITNNTDNRVLTATGGGTINGENNLTFDGTTLTVTGNATITNNLVVQGTASFQHATNLEVADRFILLASGSNSSGDGGLVVQQNTQNVGELFGWNSGVRRWAVTDSFTANQPSFTPDAFMAAVVTADETTPSPTARYNAVGNIYVSSGDESIWIYS